VYLVLQIWWLLLLAFLLGAIFGYLIWRACALPRLKSEGAVETAQLEDRVRGLETQNVRLGNLAADAEATARRLQAECDAAFAAGAPVASTETKAPLQLNGSTPPDGYGAARANGSDEGASIPSAYGIEAVSNGFLTAPRNGKADNLRLVRGIGPRLEKVLHSMGVFHFDQISRWTENDLALVDKHLGDFAGRAVRDKWIEQSRKLLERAADSDGSGNVTS
jgi:NADH-quinone oxidoreductase subunit E